MARKKRAEADDTPVGLPKNFLRACILLLVHEQPSHGYDLLERLGEIGFGKADAGGLYRALRAMEQEGLMESGWETSEMGPARRTYQLTEEGLDWLHAWAGALRMGRRSLSQYLRRYDAMFERVPRRRSPQRL